MHADADAHADAHAGSDAGPDVAANAAGAAGADAHAADADADTGDAEASAYAGAAAPALAFAAVIASPLRQHWRQGRRRDSFALIVLEEEVVEWRGFRCHPVPAGRSPRKQRQSRAVGFRRTCCSCPNYFIGFFCHSLKS